MKKLDKEEFDRWKEGNQWFWEYLEETTVRFKEALDKISHQMTNPKADLVELQKNAIEIQACINNMQDIIGLTWEDFNDN